MIAVILAAGYATRLGELTKNTPKALLDISGRPMLDNLIEKIDEVSCIDRICVVSNHKFFSHFKDWADKKNRDDIIILDDGTDSPDAQRGALGDFMFAVDSLSIDEDVLLAAGDNFFDFSIGGYIEKWNELSRPAMILTNRLSNIDDLKRFAVAQVDENMRVISLEEKPSEPKSDLGAFALYLYPASCVRLLPQYLKEGNPKDAPGHYPEWLHKKVPLYAYIAPGEIYDIGVPESLYEVREMFRHR